MSPAGSVLWALLPLFTLGLGTCVVLGWAARRLRDRLLAALSGLAFATTVVAVVLASAPTGSTRNTVAGALIVVVLVGGGLAVTFTVRRRLVGSPGDPAVADALARRQRRAEARRIAERDPGLARELGIGRPDLPHRYDDGGLADVNHVPVPVLAGLPGMTPELARRIVEARGERGGFSCVAELEVYADVPGPLAEELSDRVVFLD
ncbi:ComEA family DNA-binding protein [Streptacidiphilus rugosus]|uniref:ComEA family DNA-binding protein n=1 Tax=Streptacidiphilus rugosus TaxID=405783 RepID=UPI0012F9D4D0|nr:helix-hairpin-helix domain-containing protein [Streptacidiphilus rugosus]